MEVAIDRPTVKELLTRLDESWSTFAASVRALPAEQLEARLGENEWTRKQMLAHISAWHDIAAERLIEFAEAGRPIGHDEDEETVNARAARGAGGRTTGEVILALNESYRRLRREVARLTNDQLAAHDGWATRTIVGNTYAHYGEHRRDLERR